MLMNHKKPVALLVIVCFLLLSGCGIREKREPVQELQCTRPAALNSLCAADGAQVAVSWADYEAGSTTVPRRMPSGMSARWTACGISRNSAFPTADWPFATAKTIAGGF